MSQPLGFRDSREGFQGRGESRALPQRCFSPRRCAPPDSMPTGKAAPRQCLPIQVPVCPHSTVVHLAWQMGAHVKPGKEALGLDGKLGLFFPLLCYEGDAHHYPVPSSPCLKASWSGSIRHSIGPAERTITQVTDPSLACSCDDALRDSVLKQAALPKASSTYPYRCQEVALSCQ